MENDFPKRRRSKLNGKCVDVSGIGVRWSATIQLVVKWAVDDKLFQDLETLEGSLQCQVLNRWELVLVGLYICVRIYSHRRNTNLEIVFEGVDMCPPEFQSLERLLSRLASLIDTIARWHAANCAMSVLPVSHRAH